MARVRLAAAAVLACTVAALSLAASPTAAAAAASLAGRRLRFCSDFDLHCSQHAAPYTDCAAAVGAMAVGHEGVGAAAQDTFGCRAYHLGIAMLGTDADKDAGTWAQAYCPNAALLGGSACVNVPAAELRERRAGEQGDQGEAGAETTTAAATVGDQGEAGREPTTTAAPTDDQGEAGREATTTAAPTTPVATTTLVATTTRPTTTVPPTATGDQGSGNGDMVELGAGNCREKKCKTCRNTFVRRSLAALRRHQRARLRDVAAGSGSLFLAFRREATRTCMRGCLRRTAGAARWQACMHAAPASPLSPTTDQCPECCLWLRCRCRACARAARRKKDPSTKKLASRRWPTARPSARRQRAAKG